ncbi:hypothetical protein [Trueperella bialowiezensis]|uniref:Uncharacterized protein n=1 Tax=Trueperella bialowiezensis TaxID=312285 RepID=A0A3S5EW15_9ACTO|nr:hypothetical protein [Trueperella bialowiezensis]VEI13141.1 Uncharacterised protein [Trueperella bialowiezensis]
MSITERLKSTTVGQRVAAVAVLVVVVCVAVWLVVAGQQRAARAEAIERYETTLATFSTELAQAKQDATAVQDRLPECREVAQTSAGYVQKHEATCSTVENSLGAILDYPEKPKAVIDDLEAASVDEINAAADELEDKVAHARNMQEIAKGYDADIQSVIDTVRGEYKDKHVREALDEATAAVKAARDEIAKVPAGLIEDWVISELNTKADDLEKFVSDVEARFDEIDYEEAIDTRTSLAGYTGELTTATAELSQMATANSVGGRGFAESYRRDRDQNDATSSQPSANKETAKNSSSSTRSGSNSGRKAPAAAAPAVPTRAQAPAPAPAPAAAPNTGGWVETGDVIVENKTGEGICGDEFGNTWPC